MANKKYKFNIIDLFIILTVFAIGIVMYYYISARVTIASNLEAQVEYVVELKTVHADYLDKIKIGDKVVETVREQQIGEVVDIDISPSYVVATNMDTGEMYIQYYPQLSDEGFDTGSSDNSEKEEVSNQENISNEENDTSDINLEEPIENSESEKKYEYYNVKVTIRDTFKKSDNGYKKNAFDLVVGQIVYFRVPEFVNEGYCIAIKELPKEVEKV